ncbi:MAG: sensor of ECF-type sigma factor [Flavobacteriaceae bacterium]|nr:sensor of ECF-type sigma factor [Flavobacteriaceae bacterium]
MKRVFLISFFILTTLQVTAQANREKIKAMKTAFITNALDLSSKEAEKFWPIYNEYDKRIYRAKTIKTREIAQRVRAAGGVQQLSNSQASNILQEFIDIDFEVAKAKQDLKNKLINVVSAKKIILLFRAEQDFNKKLLRDFREQRQKNLQKRIRN